MAFYDNGSGNNYANNFQFPQGSMSNGGAQFNNNSNINMGMMNNGPDIMGVAPDPLPRGIINALSTKGYAHEPPLLEEIGINFNHILAKTKIVLTPTSVNNVLSQEILTDSDFAGPLLFFMAFGLCLLLAGRAHFGYIYGVALFGTLSLHYLSKLMASASNHRLQFFTTASILGYCFLPLCLLTLVGVFTSLNNVLGYSVAMVTVVWSTWSASGFLNSLLQLQSARALIAYPLAMFYSVFALMAIF